MDRKEELLQNVVIKFAGDSGDGMQLTGQQFTNNTAMLGIDLATFPDFPAEIRAPIGTLPGVSGFQLHFSSNKVFTPGRYCRCIGGDECRRTESEPESHQTRRKDHCEY
jgi:2-oxoglutarate ferredoxin oxidoreductase subunit alpha